jgi:hypothetical protein
VLGNAGSLIAFRVGSEDAQLLAQEFQPIFGVLDLLNLPNRNFYIRLMIEGSPSRPFSAMTLDRGQFLSPEPLPARPRPEPDDPALYR